MKNCPMFSLRSNSIESRFRSIRRGNFLLKYFVKFRKRQKKFGIRFAHKFFMLTSFGLETNFIHSHPSGCSVSES